MNWKLIGIISSSGILMGFLTVLGINRNIELIIWIILALIALIILIKKLNRRYFLHGFTAGFLAAVFATSIQIIFYSTYLQNNPNLKEQLNQLPQGFDLRHFFILIVPMIGIISGLTLGIITLVVSLFLHKSD